MFDRLSEFALIDRLFRPLATDAAALGLTDDACLLAAPAGSDLVLTADALTEGVHFRADDPPEMIAAKALRVNLSDLAAKGAEPVGYLLTLALPERINTAWLERFAQGLAKDQKLFGLSLLGGDTTATSGPLTLSITALGKVPSGGMIRRGGGKPGDGVFVSGTIGDAGAGLALLESSKTGGADHDFLIARYRMPTPRLQLGRALRGGIASAALDVSDGLIADLGHLADVSQVRIVVDANRIPLSAGVRAMWTGEEGVVRAATAGDDYEIAFTARSEEAVFAASQRADTQVCRIGHVEAGRGVCLMSQGHEIALAKTGFTHF